MNKQYNVLIVEDEKIERDALAMMVQYNCQRIDEVQTAENGIVVADILERFRPDIVLMDIHLPGMNGLDVIRLIQKKCGNVRFVIISAHNQFAYAQEALRLGVYDFLTKPVNSRDIQKVIGEMMKQMEQSHHLQENEKNQQEKINSIKPILESDCVFSIASMRSNTPIAPIFDFMQIKIHSGFVFLIQCADNRNWILEKVKFRVRSIGIICIGEIINELCVFVVLSEDVLMNVRVNEMISYIADLLNMKQLDFYLGVGDVVSSVDDLPRSYEQSLLALRNMTKGDKNILFFDEILEEQPHFSDSMMEICSQICSAMRNREVKRLFEILNHFFTALQLSGKTRQWMLEQAYQLYVLVYNSFPEISSDNFTISIERIFSYEDIQALHDLFLDYFCKMEELLDDHEKAQSNDVVAQMLQMIEQRYMDNISLDNIAQELNFSIFYLSKLFKKHAGITFTEYLTRYRIEKAKELLQQNKLSIKEIAYAVGYNSQGYFSKIFQKYTGVSPSKYPK